MSGGDSRVVIKCALALNGAAVNEGKNGTVITEAVKGDSLESLLSAISATQARVNDVLTQSIELEKVALKEARATQPPPEKRLKNKTPS